jgi:hypothetical protein
LPAAADAAAPPAPLPPDPPLAPTPLAPLAPLALPPDASLLCLLAEPTTDGLMGRTFCVLYPIRPRLHFFKPSFESLISVESLISRRFQGSPALPEKKNEGRKH